MATIERRFFTKSNKLMIPSPSISNTNDSLKNKRCYSMNSVASFINLFHLSRSKDSGFYCCFFPLDQIHTRCNFLDTHVDVSADSHIIQLRPPKKALYSFKRSRLGTVSWVDDKLIKAHITTEGFLDPIPVFTRPSPSSSLGKVIV